MCDCFCEGDSGDYFVQEIDRVVFAERSRVVFAEYCGSSGCVKKQRFPAKQ